MDSHPTVEQVMKSNPHMTYGFATGYVTGLSARNQFEGLSADEWRSATDDYAHGYREGYLAKPESPAPVVHKSWYSDQCHVEVYERRCPHCGKTKRESK